MTISVDWANTKVIYVEKTDLTLVQASPQEIYDLDLNVFRLTLLDLQDDVDGRPWQKTYKHNTEVDLGGLTYARTFEIVAPYTVTFEDGKYAVNLVGANSNVADRTNVNQVSVRPQNSAGMTSSKDIEYGAFNGGVTYDVDSPYSGSIGNVGKPNFPVNNFNDLKQIATYRGFSKVYALSDVEFEDDDEFIYYSWFGQGKDETIIILPDLAVIESCKFYDAKVSGYLDGNSKTISCLLENIYYIQGEVTRCRLSGIGEITLGGTGDCHFVSCYSGKPGTGTPVINCGGDGPSLGFRDYNGGVLIKNKTGTAAISIDLQAGQVRLDLTTVTNGQIVVRGDGKVVDDATGEHIWTGTYGNLEIINETNSVQAIIDYDLTGYSKHGTTGAILVRSAYRGVVEVNINNGEAGTEFPVGLKHHPVNNIPDALELLDRFHLSGLCINDDVVIPASTNLNGINFCSGGTIDRTITIPDTALTNGTKFKGIILTGSLNGRTEIKGCTIENLDGIRGTVLDSSFSGDIGFDDTTGQTIVLARCYSSGEKGIPNFHIYNAKLSITDWIGKAVFDDKTGSSYLGTSCNGGVFDITAACVAGFIIFTGEGKVNEDLSGAGCTVLHSDMLNKENITKEVVTYNGEYHV